MALSKTAQVSELVDARSKEIGLHAGLSPGLIKAALAPAHTLSHQPSATQKPFQESVVEGALLTPNPLSRTFEGSGGMGTIL